MRTSFATPERPYLLSAESARRSTLDWRVAQAGQLKFTNALQEARAVKIGWQPADRPGMKVMEQAHYRVSGTGGKRRT
jgi:hypothetical protein